MRRVDSKACAYTPSLTRFRTQIFVQLDFMSGLKLETLPTQGLGRGTRRFFPKSAVIVATRTS